MQSVVILGSTGSIGCSTIDVLARHPERYRAFALTANDDWRALLEQCLRLRPEHAVVCDPTAAAKLRTALAQAGAAGIEVHEGAGALATVAAAGEADIVMAAIVGAAGLAPTMAAVRAGKKILLANKEALVMAGPLFTRAVNECGATLLPIDSEHNAIFQCLPPEHRRGGLTSVGVERILLTASGGPFRERRLEDLAGVTPEEACAHPNWSMGRKISVDSATLMNKGLELIEACWLFETGAERVEVVIHPQSIVHSMVSYVDGSVLAQLGNPDMRTPIAHALAWPERITSGVAPLDLVALGPLTFEAPDRARFPCLTLAEAAAAAGGTAPAVLNAVNEVAVAAFLSGILPFTSIAEVIDSVMQTASFAEPGDIEAVQQADLQARRRAEAALERRLATS